MVGAAATGVLSYNGYVFDGTSKVRTSVRYVYDESGRIVKWQELTIMVSCTIADGANGSIDGEMTDIRALLGQSGKGLVFTQRGFGNDVSVNVPGGQQDLSFGPHPEVLSWTPIGSNRAAEVEWQVRTTIKPCGANVNTTNVITEFNYTVEWNVDYRGLTQRRISGFIEVANSKNDKGVITRSADQFRSSLGLQAQRLDGFSRTQHFDIDLAKSRENFTVVDEQIPSRNAFAPGMAMMRGRHDVMWSRGAKGTRRIRNVISLSIEPLLGVNPTQAWAIFGQIVEQRINIAKAAGKVVLLDEIRVSEDLFGLDCDFQVSYRFLSCLSKLITDAGLFTPINTNWTAWKTSMNVANGVRGLADLGHLPMDAVVNVCTPYSDDAKEVKPKKPANAATRSTVFKNAIPPAANSWLEYNMTVVPQRTRPVTRQSVMQPYTADDSAGADMNASKPFDYGTAAKTTDIIQVSGEGKYAVTLQGHAVRAGHNIPRPYIGTVGNKTAVEMNGKFAQKVVGNYLGVPIYAAAWILNYLVDSSPGIVSPSKDLAGCYDDKGNAVSPNE